MNKPINLAGKFDINTNLDFNLPPAIDCAFDDSSTFNYYSEDVGDILATGYWRHFKSTSKIGFERLLNFPKGSPPSSLGLGVFTGHGYKNSPFYYDLMNLNKGVYNE